MIFDDLGQTRNWLQQRLPAARRRKLRNEPVEALAATARSLARENAALIATHAARETLLKAAISFCQSLQAQAAEIPTTGPLRTLHDAWSRYEA